MKYRSPNKSTMTPMLEMVTGDDLKIEEAGDFSETDLFHQGVFIDAEGAIVATCDCDLAATVGLGCALSMIPVAGMESMLEERSLSASGKANFYEMMNIFSSLFMDDRSPHLKLSKVLEDSFAVVDGDESGTASFTVMLGKYGGGRVRFRYL